MGSTNNFGYFILTFRKMWMHHFTILCPFCIQNTNLKLCFSRWLVPNKSFRSSSVVESSFHNRPEANENECDLDTMKKLKLGARSSLWLRPTGRKGDHTDYSIAV